MQEGKICVSNLKLAPDLKLEIREAQGNDRDFQAFKSKMLGKENSDFWEGENRALYFHDQICVPNNGDLWEKYWEKHTIVGIVSTLERLKCTKT
jgi:hypothetical protein